MKEEMRTVLQALEAMESADAHFHACQSNQFRHFIRSQLGSRNLSQAMEKLWAFLKKDGGEEHGT